MCGICGIVNSDLRQPVERNTLERMRDAIAFRGPDEAGTHIDGGVGLAIRRLSIIDLATGKQPITNEDRSMWIVFNGEIYNYLELRETYLEGKHRFSTSSDTEVILHLYEEFGEDCVRYLNGMFAFAIWDARKRRLFVARDRLGIKPLYYSHQNGAFLFASEIKSLLQHEGCRVEVRHSAIDEFITFGYVQTPHTLFDNVLKLPPGSTLTLQDGKIDIRQYWDLEFGATEKLALRDYEEQLLELLSDSVRLRLRSDVPLGVLLSGGIDSSTITALLARSVGKIKTFSIGFSAGKQFNELEFARQVATHFSTDHHEMILSPQSFRDFIPGFIYHMDEPVTEGAAISLFFVSQLAAREVKVVLTGEGADEIFGGYPIYRIMQLIETYRRFPSVLRRKLLDPLLAAAWPNPKIDKYLFLAQLPLQQRYLNVHLYDIRLRDQLFNAEFFESIAPADPLDRTSEIYRKTESWDLLSRLLYLDTKTWLPDDLLIKADRMSMANSIELRVPFLDHRLVEFAARVPSKLKLRGSSGKFLLKRAVKDLVPRSILQRPKMGFPTPLAWMFKGDLHPYVREVILDRRTEQRGYFDQDFVRRVLAEHLDGKADHHKILWRLLVLEEWHRQFVDSTPGEPLRAPIPAEYRPATDPVQEPAG